MAVKKRCAYLTMEDTTGFFIYDHLTFEPLAQLGWHAEEIPWNRNDVRWDEFDVVVIRSPWDYQNDPDDFLRVLTEIDASSARLENPLDIVRWNLQKTYLNDLQERGVAIVPTVWLCGLDNQKIADLYRTFNVDEIIVKPVIGANADDTFRLAKDQQPEQARAAVATFQDRPLMAQPFLHAIVDEGEYSLFYLGGEYSHCIRKVPKVGDFRVQEEHGGLISSAIADAELLTAGQKAIDAIGQQLLYARVDLVRLPSEQPVLMELELIEPSLYFPFGPQSLERFAAALDQLPPKTHN